MATPIKNILPRAGLLLGLSLLSVSVSAEAMASAAEAPLPTVGTAARPGDVTGVVPGALSSPSADESALMRSDMHTYFAGEKLGGSWLMGVGAPALAVGTGLLFHPGEFYRGLGYPLLVFGALEILGGLAFYVNTNRRVPRFDRQLIEHPLKYRDEELVRIRRVNRDMRMLAAVEITVFLAGGTMAGVGAQRKLDTVAGIGTGLMIESAVLFLYDQLAARRALRYTDSLTRFTIGMTAGPGPAPSGAMLTMLRTL